MSKSFDEYLASVHIPISEYEKSDIAVKAQILQVYNQAGLRTAGITTEIESLMRRVFISMKPKEILIRRWQFPGELKLFSFTDETSIEEFQVWCMATFSVGDPRIYFLLNKTDWETRERIVDTAAMLNFFSYSIRDKKRISQIVISCEQTTPTKAPVDFDSTSEMSVGSVKVSSTLSRGDCQMVFRNQVLSRDKNLCVFCGSIESLEAAHIFNVKDGGDESSYAKLGKLHLHTLYDIGNGITLCYNCHKLFDWHLCSVHIENNDSSKVYVVATDALLESSDEKEKSKWENLNGKLVNIPVDPLELSRNWPLASLFQYRESEFLSSNLQRRKSKEGKVVCPQCNVPVSSNCLSRHLLSKKCVNLASSQGKKKSQYTTPLKSDSTV